MQEEKLTPMMEQYYEMKRQYPDCILFFRLGDFYEMFGDDAIMASKILEIVLTSRNKGGDTTKMCGIPYHAADHYLAKLTKAGKKVAICEQMSDPKLPGIVKREVIRVVTPGTTLNDNLLHKATNNFVLCIFPKENYFGMSFADITTGEFRVTEIHGRQQLINEFERVRPRECIIKKDFFDSEIIHFLQNEFSETCFFPFETSENGYQVLTRFFQTKSLEGFGVEKWPFGIQAAGILLQYLKETQKNDLKHIRKLSTYSLDDFMILDDATIRNLELISSQNEGKRESSLLGVLDDTLTPMGGRLLRQWLLKPLLKIKPIQNRLEAVDELFRNQRLTEDIKDELKKIHDLERILGRLSMGTGNARDLIALKASLKTVPFIKKYLSEANSTLLIHICDRLHENKELVEFLERAIVDDPPLTLREGGMICDGFHQELDELRNLSRSGHDILKEIQKKAVSETGINSLKIGFTKVFGYYIEVSNTHREKVPAHFIRKQTLVNAERFITPELKEHEEKILGAEEKIKELEYKLFQTLREEVLKQLRNIQETAYFIGVLDVLHNFARKALMNNYCKPKIIDDAASKDEVAMKKVDDCEVNGVNSKEASLRGDSEEREIEKGDIAGIFIKNGRHPVVELIRGESRFVPNDTDVDGNENRFILITGPNMAGKSVYLRQVALITLMAHIGSFVPATEAKINMVDRIFTRVGASDHMGKGQSTFMVEMNETANILNNATEKSLIILDEIGRGTSTYDGVSIAWAMTEYLHNTIKAKTLFATHYHELIAVAEKLSGAKNMSAMVKETADGIIFLYKIQHGGIDRSYGIEVARLAGLPQEVTNRARQILEDLEEKIVEQGIKAELLKGKYKEDQMDLFRSEKAFSLQQTYRSGSFTHPALEALKQVDINAMTPLEALKKLDDLKAKINE